MKDVEYAYAVAYIKTLENKMLTYADIQSLIAADTGAAARDILRNRGWEGSTNELLLKNELEASWKIAYEVCPPDAPIDILLFENDFHNMKTVFKAKAAGADWRNMILKPSVVEPEVFEEAIRNGDFSALPPFIRGASEQTYHILTTTMDGQLAEIYADKCAVIAVLDRAKEEKNEFLIGWAELVRDIVNMKTAWRALATGKSKQFIENALIPSPSSERLIRALQEQEIKDAITPLYRDADVSSIGAFERWCDNKKIEYVKRAKAGSFGFLPIFAFLVGKSYEIQTVRIILSCKENGVSDTVIRERLRDMYV